MDLSFEVVDQIRDLSPIERFLSLIHISFDASVVLLLFHLALNDCEIILILALALHYSLTFFLFRGLCLLVKRLVKTHF